MAAFEYLVRVPGGYTSAVPRRLCTVAASVVPAESK
jgi:hypothetical protein